MWELIKKWIENKSYRCEHNWELLTEKDVYLTSSDKMPHMTKFVYRCKKCCKSKTIKT
jgi:hypothetical protein